MQTKDMKLEAIVWIFMICIGNTSFSQLRILCRKSPEDLGCDLREFWEKRVTARLSVNSFCKLASQQEEKPL